MEQNVELIHARHDFEMLRGKMVRELTDMRSMLQPCPVALSRTPPKVEIVAERIDETLADITKVLAYLESLKGK